MVWCLCYQSMVWCSCYLSMVWCSCYLSMVWCSCYQSRVWCSCYQYMIGAHVIKYSLVLMLSSMVWCSCYLSMVWCSCYLSMVWCSGLSWSTSSECPRGVSSGYRRRPSALKFDPTWRDSSVRKNLLPNYLVSYTQFSMFYKINFNILKEPLMLIPVPII